MTDKYYLQSRASAEQRFADLRSYLNDAQELAGQKACVYSTGSFGRSEAGPNSDLDLFIVIDEIEDNKKTKDPSKPVLKRALSNIDETKLRCHLIGAVERSDIAPFDGDGKYLESHLFGDFVRNLGSRDDDYRNTFTGRMLLLLESKPLVGEEVYRRLIDGIIEKYFRDFDDNQNNFLPSYLVNDILRMWRTFCVNYEFGRRDAEPKYKVKNLKLKFSRMLTCYSAIVCMLSVFGRTGTFTPNDARAMVGRTPTERFEDTCADHRGTPIAESLESALSQYSDFLQFAHLPEDELEPRIISESSDWRRKSQLFGGAVAETIEGLGRVSGGNELHRIVLI